MARPAEATRSTPRVLMILQLGVSYAANGLTKWTQVAHWEVGWVVMGGCRQARPRRTRR